MYIDNPAENADGREEIKLLMLFWRVHGMVDVIKLNEYIQRLYAYIELVTMIIVWATNICQTYMYSVCILSVSALLEAIYHTSGRHVWQTCRHVWQTCLVSAFWSLQRTRLLQTYEAKLHTELA